MGRQHGSTEGIENKIPLNAANESPYRPLVAQLHYGPYGFMEEHLAKQAEHRTNSLVMGGFADEMVQRYHAALGGDALLGNVDATTLLAGQRLRWRNAPGERSIQEIYEAVARQTGADMDALREKSPWIRAEEQKSRDETDIWSGPYATEFEIGRLCTEAYFREIIDWKGYEVESIEDSAANEQAFVFRGQTYHVPAREQAAVTYFLRNGTKAHVLNARALPRAQGVPRPNCDSQTREALELGLITDGPQNISVAVSPPHIRAGIDVVIRALSLAGERVRRTEIVAHAPLPGMEVLTALGEIPATHKADLRLRALFAGEDPDSKQLQML
jgi:hypothetical protein